MAELGRVVMPQRAGEERRDADGDMAQDYVRRPTAWQAVIHGPAGVLRKRYVEWLIEHGRTKRALVYSMCGMGDELYEVRSGVARVRPKRCGDRFCPRCSRYAGLKFVRQVTGHLSRGAHGAIYHMVLTQRVRPRETLMGTRERFESKWRRFWRLLDGAAFVAGLRTTHVTWSRHGGWHLHVHIVAEFSGGDAEQLEAVERLLEWWRQQVRGEGSGRVDDMFARLICDAGPKMGEVHQEAAELWPEPSDEVEKALAYVVRDACQGVESWHLDRAGEEIEELFGGVAGAKMHRLLGEWRRSPEDRYGLDESEGVEAAPPPRDSDVIGGELCVGTVDKVVYDALGGVESAREILRWLLVSLSNSGLVAERIREMLTPICR